LVEHPVITRREVAALVFESVGRIARIRPGV
jgi:hypothetical protein